MRTLILTLGLLAAATPLVAQNSPSDPDNTVSDGDTLAAGWHARLDRANASMEDVRFVSMGDGYHVTLGPAAIFYNPDHIATGEYRVHATLTQTRAPEHAEAYGLFIGGRNLDAGDQEYLYFLVRQDGRFLIKRRAGDETHTLVDWTEHAAITEAGEEGEATNELAAEVGANGARFLVNGTQVADLDRVDSLSTDGIAGLRVNHNLDVHIADFGIEGGEGV